jgi:hypothetical protein
MFGGGISCGINFDKYDNIQVKVCINAFFCVCVCVTSFILKCVFVCLLMLQLEAVLLLTAKPRNLPSVIQKQQTCSHICCIFFSRSYKSY